MSLFTRLFQPAPVLILSAILVALTLWLLVAGGLAHLALLAPFRWNI